MAATVTMRSTLYDRLWQRECGDLPPRPGLRTIYGSQEWVDDLDIVNELGGHMGCINALSWSRSGSLLASGSDDRHLNIYSYQSDSSDAPFSLKTTVATGHKANIFSVKFMPHSNDRTLVTCAGDSQVRVFDIEYASRNGNAAATSALAASARSRRFNNFFDGTTYLNESNTNARVYRSHADRVKRIVTESSPHLFLTCSEDGEVRQWDLRQPSSAYPAPNGGQGFMAYRPGLQHDDSNVPPPLISYKRFNLDLNTISCSPSQPHYIALGGAHMHCFLHDRRMLGRDISAERGSPSRSPPSVRSRDDEMMGQATRCVRRFAPGGKNRMSEFDDGHITACKISDANPNEMVVSWSGDHIYSFDLARSPDARDSSNGPDSGPKSPSKHRKNNSRTRKRKRSKPTSTSSQESATRYQYRRRSAERQTTRLGFHNGDVSDVPILDLSEVDDQSPESILERARDSVLSDAQKLSMEIAKGLVKLRRALFSIKRTPVENVELDPTDLSLYSESFESVFNLASTYLPRMNTIIRSWRYPLNPTQEIVSLQQTLRRNRLASWRFVQAAGTLAQSLKGRNDEAEDPQLHTDFLNIIPAPSEDESIEREAQFGYDFLKAILLWLRGGRPELLAGFKRWSCNTRPYGRFPIPEEAGEEAIDDILIPYLQSLASDVPIVNVDYSELGHEGARFLFQTERAAVTAFAARFDRRRVSIASSSVQSLDRASATKFWVLRVGRGILMAASNGVNFAFVNRAFGGLHTAIYDPESESDEGILGDDGTAGIAPMESELPIGGPDTTATPRMVENQPTSEDESSDRSSESGDHESEDDDPGDSSDGWDYDVAFDSDSDEPYRRRYSDSQSRRGEIEINTPCSSHMRAYRGHCNIKTVKDVNFFGLDDQYVVSGSDSGHVFIWDRKTSKLVNILEGDSEVVNVVQGHPYEPMMAVSGIDNTIKIFSPDRHAQAQARQGINILNPDHLSNILGPHGHIVPGLQSRKSLHDSYRIISQNDVDRRGGMSEAYITRSMLARLAATLRGRQGLGADLDSFGGDQTGEGATIVLDENCLVM
ncbi:hypothetical protein N7468_000836 [Penicillium chermesinum]|uniref:Uncharacterized protein n=1 Tax=Penicillium chermesinum TaxID=63820 RepID=A0A9W9PFF9_9EURO|nr:uncharacterized protein N7468_000836 [Penicillium chermesinum]KAJ5245853.1 hypothetical protein N7468_000836 [Penicillium chermesinum]